MSRNEVVPGTPSLFEIFDSIPAILWTADATTFSFTWVSGGSSSVIGYSPEEWMASRDFWRDHVHPDDRHVVTICRTETARGRDHELVYRMIAADGRIVWIRDTVRVHVENGKPVSLSGIMLDITKEREAIEAVTRSEENYRRLVNAAPDAIGVHTRGHFVYVNPKFVELFGASHDADLIGRDVLSLVHPDFRDVVRHRQVEVAVGNNVPMTREKLVRIDGTAFDAEVMAIPLVFNGAKAVQVIVRATYDIAVTVAHEVDELLTTILSFTEVLATNDRDSERRQRALHAIGDAVARGKRITDEIVSYAKRADGRD